MPGAAAVPSSLMLGMTTYLTTDIAAIPFFWVIPLAQPSDDVHPRLRSMADRLDDGTA
ncbi:MAG: hypothetical protein U0744_14690 [Gemmataceae bacterium]